MNAENHCKHCDGQGVLSTGMAEWPTEFCIKCDGTGYEKQVKFYSWRESFDMCSQQCKWWSHDMDDAFCTHEKSLAASRGVGLSLNAMIREKLCTGCSDTPENNKRELFEPRVK